MTDARRIVVDGRLIPYEAGDSVAVAILRSGEHPHHGGTICLAGDCGNCVAQVDGVAYVRTCQTPATHGLEVRQHPAFDAPPLPVPTSVDLTGSSAGSRIGVQRSEADLVVIGAGDSGTAAAARARRQGRSVTVLDARDGMEVVGIYAGPTVIVRVPGGMLHINAHDVVVATGAAELQPICPGSMLIGLVTARAAQQLHAAGVDLGVAVAIGAAPVGVPCTPLPGRLLRIEGDGRVSGVVTLDDDGSGNERTTACDTVILGLGRAARDVLSRMADNLPVTVVGSASEAFPLPAPPIDGTVCPCCHVNVEDLEGVWDRGFRELELVKRASLVGTGTC